MSSKRYFGTKKILCQLVSVLKKVNKSQPFQVDFLREKCIEELNRRTQRQYGLGIERVMARELGLQKCLILTEKLFFSAIVVGPCLTSSSEEIHDFPGGT